MEEDDLGYSYRLCSTVHAWDCVSVHCADLSLLSLSLSSPAEDAVAQIDQVGVTFYFDNYTETVEVVMAPENT